MTSRLDRGTKIPEIPRVCPSCGRQFFRSDYEAERDYLENEKPMSPLRLLALILALFITVGGLFLAIIEALLGIGLVAAGILSLPAHSPT